MREFDAALVRRQDDHDRDVTIAWYVAALSRQERMPQLESLLTQKPQRQTHAEQQRAALRQFAEYYRIPIREVKN